MVGPMVRAGHLLPALLTHQLETQMARLDMPSDVHPRLALPSAIGPQAHIYSAPNFVSFDEILPHLFVRNVIGNGARPPIARTRRAPVHGVTFRRPPFVFASVVMPHTLRWGSLCFLDARGASGA